MKTKDFLINLMGVFMGVFLAFLLQDFLHKEIVKKKTEKIVFMTYYESLYNFGTYLELYDTYSYIDSTGFNKTKFSTDFANELLFQSNKTDFISYLDIGIMYNYINLAKITNKIIDDYCNYLMQRNNPNAQQNKIFREKITELLIEFCAETKFVQDMTKQYDFERNSNYELKVAIYKEIKENYIKAIQQGKLDVDIK